jgi:hypothetical protein
MGDAAMRTSHPKVKEQESELGMVGELVFKDAAAAEYDHAFAHVTCISCPSCCGPLTLHRVCASLTSRRARDFRPKRPSSLSATPAMLILQPAGGAVRPQAPN